MRLQVLFWIGSLIAAAHAMRVRNTYGWKKIARAHPSTPIPVSIAVRQENLDIVDKLFWDISNPKSENYTKYLTSAQIEELVRNPESTRAVEKFLFDNGAAILSNSNDGLFIETRLPAHKVEDLFKAEFNIYVQKNGAHIVKTEHFEIPSELLNHVSHLPHIAYFPKYIRFGKTQKKPSDDTAYVSPQLLFNYYGISNPKVSANSASTLSLFEALNSDFSNADLDTFQNKFNLISHDIKSIIGPNDESACLNQQTAGNCFEANLDVQYILAIAQNATSTFWNIPSQNIFIDWIKAVSNTENPPLVHSMSYGGYEAQDEDLDYFNTEAKKLGLRGLTILVSSGDDGVANFQVRGDPTQCGYNPSFPATSPFVTAVGATQGPEESKPEIGCSSTTDGGITTGGGFSTHFVRPAYQDNQVKAYLSQTKAVQGYNAGGRGIPDVSALGRNYVIVVGQQFNLVSGTSASTPVFAGMITLINDCRLQKGKNPLGFLNQALYSLDPSVFNDVTQGENNCSADPGDGTGPTCCQQGFSAAPGWDPLTGLGTPKFAPLLKALCAL
jgi:tripeptidyl-peptidase-1